jgi:anti-anti-sigma factor
VIHNPPGPVRSDDRPGRTDDPVRLRFSGPLDRVRAAAAGDAFRSVGVSRRVIVDLERVTFVDSAGLRMLAEGIRSVGASGGSTVLEGPSPWLSKVLQIVGVDRLASVAPEDGDPAPT